MVCLCNVLPYVDECRFYFRIVDGRLDIQIFDVFLWYADWGLHCCWSLDDDVRNTRILYVACSEKGFNWLRHEFYWFSLTSSLTTCNGCFSDDFLNLGASRIGSSTEGNDVRDRNAIPWRAHLIDAQKWIWSRSTDSVISPFLRSFTILGVFQYDLNTCLLLHCDKYSHTHHKLIFFRPYYIAFQPFYLLHNVPWPYDDNNLPYLNMSCYTYRIALLGWNVWARVLFLLGYCWRLCRKIHTEMPLRTDFSLLITTSYIWFVATVLFPLDQWILLQSEDHSTILYIFLPKERKFLFVLNVIVSMRQILFQLTSPLMCAPCIFGPSSTLSLMYIFYFSLLCTLFVDNQFLPWS